jgi:TonB-dependent receptor
MPMTEFEKQEGGQRLPIVDPAAIRAKYINDPAYFYQDLNLTATSIYTGRRIMKEGVDAAYLQATAKFGRLTLLGGVREEWVNTHSFTYFFRPTRTLIATEPDPFKRAALDAVRQSIKGTYSKNFPSIHLAYDITSNLRAHVSWSTSYGRPSLTQIVAAVTPNDSAKTLTVGNPALKPQMAKNLDFKLEYYMREGGLISVAAYQKKITDYIGSAVRTGTLVPDGPNNGFDGQYAGYELIQSNNLGYATLNGAEFEVRRRLSFLPGVLKGLTARANYTYLETHGRFSGTTDLQNGQVAGFIPRSYNFGLMYNYGKFGASYDLNYTGKFPVAYSLTSPGNGNVYRDGVTLQNVGVTYKYRPSLTVFLNLNNFAQEGMRQYTYLASRVSLDRLSPRAIKFGVTGQF